MLAAAKIAVVLHGAFVEFESAIVELFAVVTERLHLIGREWRKVTKDRQILIENPHGIDSTDGRGDGQAHGVGKRFGGGECALRDTLTRTAHALHSHGCDASLIDDGQDIVFKAAEARVQGIKRHLDNIESMAPGEHLQVDRRVLVSVKSHETDLSLLLCLGEGFENTVVRVDQLGVIVEDDLVNLPDIEMIGLQPVERCLQHAHRSFWTRVRGEGAHHDDVVSFAFEGDAELLFAEAFVKLPGIVEDVDAVVDGFANHIVHLSLVRNGAEMEAAHAEDGTLEAGTPKRTLLRREAGDVGSVVGLDCSGDLLS